APVVADGVGMRTPPGGSARMVGRSVQYPSGPSQHRASERVLAGLAEAGVSPTDVPVSAPRDTQLVQDKFERLRGPRESFGTAEPAVAAGLGQVRLQRHEALEARVPQRG